MRAGRWTLFLVARTVTFDTAYRNGKLVPNKVTLAAILNGMGNERYSNRQLTKAPITSLGDRILPVQKNFKTLQEKHWETLYKHTEASSALDMVVTENFATHKHIRNNTSIKSLGGFFTECFRRRKQGLPLSFDPLFSEEDIRGENVNISILFETSETTQQDLFQILGECLYGATRGSL